MEWKKLAVSGQYRRFSLAAHGNPAALPDHQGVTTL